MYELKTRDKERLLEWNNTQNKTIEIQRISSKENQLDSHIEDFCRILTKTSPRIKCTVSVEENHLPGIKLLENIIFSSIPLEMELPPFIEALSLLGNVDIPVLSEQTKANLNKIDIPVSLKLYIARQCPHCPEVVRTVIPLAIACPHIKLTIVDGTLFNEEALKDGVMSAPCLILDQDFRWTGMVSPEEITNMIVNRDPSQLSTHSLKTILEEGKADWISSKMTEQNKIFHGFIDLVTHENWSVRLGAMVILESLAEDTPELAATIGPELLSRFADSDVTVQGDILYALGETGDLKTRDKIKKITRGIDDPELMEAAREAIGAIEARG